MPQQIEGMPFRNLNDNVTPVVIGGNDWAAAWAMDELGQRTDVPGGAGAARGERQRELAYRFGVNIDDACADRQLQDPTRSMCRRCWTRLGQLTAGWNRLFDLAPLVPAAGC